MRSWEVISDWVFSTQTATGSCAQWSGAEDSRRKALFQGNTNFYCREAKPHQHSDLARHRSTNAAWMLSTATKGSRNVGGDSWSCVLVAGTKTEKWRGQGRKTMCFCVLLYFYFPLAWKEAKQTRTLVGTCWRNGTYRLTPHGPHAGWVNSARVT
jgi:hypothetical protein